MTYNWPHVAGNTAACFGNDILDISIKFCFKFSGNKWLLWCHRWWQSWPHHNFQFPVQGVPLCPELFCGVVMTHNYRILMSLTLAWKKWQLFAPHLTVVFTTSLPCDVTVWRRKLLLAPHIFFVLFWKIQCGHIITQSVFSRIPRLWSGMSWWIQSLSVFYHSHSSAVCNI